MTIRWTSLNLKLSHKGFILVAVPLVFEILFVLCLSSLLRQAEFRALQEAHVRDVTGEANLLAKLIGDAAMAMAAYSNSLSRSKSEDCERAIDQIAREIWVFDRLVQDNLDSLPESRRVMAEGLSAFRSAKAMVDNQEVSNLDRLRGLRKEMKKVMPVILPELRRIAERQEALAGQSGPTAELEGRVLIQNFLLAGVIFNILLAVALAAFFNKSTARRLQVLLDNTTRFGRDRPLNPPIDGSDEIATVDHTFHEMAHALSEARRKERAVIDNAADVICSIDREGKFTAVNPASLKILGYNQEELLGIEVWQLIFEEDLSAFARDVNEVIARKSVGTFDARVRNKHGVLVDLEWSLSWSEAEQSLFCVVHDVTAKKEVERLKRQFISMVSHDLRSPLFAIQCSLTLASEGAENDLSERALKHVKTAERNTDRLIRLVNDLLDMEKMEAGKMELVRDYTSMFEVANRSIESVHALAKDKDVEIRFAGRDLDAWADPDRLVQVLVNLLANAIKFSPKNGVILINVRDEGDFVVVEVKDQGPGIAPEHQGYVFDRFKQIKGKDKLKGGTGLGLAISKAIVEMHGGTISLQSEPGKGATFWFSIPVEPPSDAQVISSPQDNATTIS